MLFLYRTLEWLEVNSVVFDSKENGLSLEAQNLLLHLTCGFDWVNVVICRFMAREARRTPVFTVLLAPLPWTISSKSCCIIASHSYSLLTILCQSQCSLEVLRDSGAR